MTTLENVKIEYRAPRIGFCIRYGNISDLITASKINSLLWGGIHNPIIPVGAPNDLDSKLASTFRVDILVPIQETPEIKLFMDKYKWARFPRAHFSNEIITEDSFKRDHKQVRVLDVSHIINNLWESEFKFSKPENSNCAVTTWSAKDPFANIFTLTFGQYPKEKFSYNYQSNYKKLLRTKTVKIDKDKLIPSSLANLINPIQLTEYEVKSYGGSDLRAGIYVGDPKNFDDLVNFWNIRALDCHVAFLPAKTNKRFTSYIKKHISATKRKERFGNKSFVNVWFIEKNDSDRDKVEQVIKPLKNEKTILGLAGITNHFWEHTRASYNLIKESSCTSSSGVKFGKPTFSFQLSDKPLPPQRERRYLDQFFVVTLRPSFSFDFTEYTSDLPILADLNEWYSKEMMFDPFSLRVGKNHLGRCLHVVTEIDRDVLDINPIPKLDLIQKILSRAGITAKKSGAGLIAERLIALMGGVSGSARIFKIRGTRRFIEDTHPLHQKSKYEIEKAINDTGSFKQFENEFGLKGHTPMTPEDVFDTMIERNLLQTGIEVQCPKCSIKSWVNLKDVREQYECEYCNEKCKFIETTKPITIKNGEELKKIDGIRWHYRLSGLLGKSDKQQGAIPVILTILHLSNRLHSGFGKETFSTALDLSYQTNNKVECSETDLFVMDLQEMMGKEDLEILIGECKNGQRITREQVDRLVNVQKLIEKSGIKCHIVFTKTKGGFNQNELGHFKRLYSQGIKPLLFTDKELEKWWNEYRDFEKSRKDFKLPVDHPFTFSDLAENSAYVYKLY